MNRLPAVVDFGDGVRVYLTREDGTADALRRVCSLLTGVPVSQAYRIIPASTYGREYERARRAKIASLAGQKP